MRHARLKVAPAPSGPAVASALGVLGVVLLAASVPPGLIAHNLSVASTVPNIVVELAYGAVGLVVARQQPRNAVGWILLVFAVLLATSSAAGPYAALIYHFGHRSLPFGPAAVLLDLLWGPAIVLIPLALLLFPDGTLASSRWRWVLRAYLVIGAAWPVSIYTVAIATVVKGHFQVADGGDLSIVDQPSGSAAWLIPAQELILPALIVFWLLFVIRQVASFRRASDERRQQLKWLMAGAGACLAGAAAVTVGGTLGGSSKLVGGIVDVGSVVTIAFPLSMGVGILKYRLYDIDRIISRTLAYAIITGLLVGVYAGLVLLVTEVLTFTTPVAVATATLIAAALFSPLRRRVQRAVDRRFNRARYDADRAVAAFAARLKDAVDPDAVRADLLGSVQRALEPAHASVWISSP